MRRCSLARGSVVSELGDRDRRTEDAGLESVEMKGLVSELRVGPSCKSTGMPTYSTDDSASYPEHWSISPAFNVQAGHKPQG